MMKKEIYKVKRMEGMGSCQIEKIESDWIKRLFDGKKSTLILNEPKNQLQGVDFTGKTGETRGSKWR